MSEEKKSISYIHFLKNEMFIEWKLFQTDELNGYWERYKVEHPEELESFMLAERLFADFKFSDFKIPQDAKEATIVDLVRESSRQINRRRIRSVYRYAAAVVVGLALISTFIYHFYYKGDDRGSAAVSYIVGNELESKDIQLVTNSKTSSFKENIEISVTNDGRAIVKSEKDDHLDEDIDVDDVVLNKLIVPYGKRTTLNLSDGTKVWLNSGTVLEFPASFSGDSRDVYLASGEIFVEAAKVSKMPFYVHTGDFDVKVYGTMFNVSSYADSPSAVVLVEGSVSLKLPNELNEIFISPSEQVTVLGEGGVEKKVVDVNNLVSWKNGYLIFDETPMSEVLRQIGRYYNLSFDFNQDVKIQQRACTGKISLTENLDVVMTTISLLSLTNYEKQGNKIIITN